MNIEEMCAMYDNMRNIGKRSGMTTYADANLRVLLKHLAEAGLTLADLRALKVTGND